MHIGSWLQNLRRHLARSPRRSRPRRHGGPAGSVAAQIQLLEARELLSGVLTDTTPATNPIAFAGDATGNVVLATFTDANTSAAASDFTPTVDWGAALTGTPTVSVQLVSQSALGSAWQVVGNATYAARGYNTVTVNIADTSGDTSQSANTSFSVFNANPPATFDLTGEYSVTTPGSNSQTLANISPNGLAIPTEQSANNASAAAPGTPIGDSLVLTTGTPGVVATATVTSSSQILVNGTDIATFGDDRITFTTGTFAGQVWTKISLPANYTNPAGGAVHITQYGGGYMFTDSMGKTAWGTWLTPNSMLAFSETVTFKTGEAVWSDGTVWHANLDLSGSFRVVAAGNGAIPDYIGLFDVTAVSNQLHVTNYVDGNGGASYVIENGTSNVVFVDSQGSMSLGTFINVTQAIFNQDPTRVATFAGDRITWQDGTDWTQTVSAGPSPPVVTSYTNLYGVATYTIQNATTNVVFVDSHGEFSLGAFTNSTQAVDRRYAGDGAAFGADTVTWQDGQVWTRTANPPITITEGSVHYQVLSTTTLIGLDGPQQGLIGTRKDGGIYWPVGPSGELWNFDQDALNALFEMGTG